MQGRDGAVRRKRTGEISVGFTDLTVATQTSLKLSHTTPTGFDLNTVLHKYEDAYITCHSKVTQTQCYFTKHFIDVVHFTESGGNIFQ